MDWLKKNYDLALLGLASLAVAASAALFALGGPGETDQAMLPPMPQRPDAQAPASPIEAVRQATALLDGAPTTAPKNQSEAALRGSPFVSRPYLLKEGKLFDPIEGGEYLHPPLKNDWVIANNLDYSDPGLTTADPDQDGFNNEEEFVGKTDPNDPQSMPPSFTKLRLVRFTPIPFRIQFKGVAKFDDPGFEYKKGIAIVDEFPSLQNDKFQRKGSENQTPLKELIFEGDIITSFDAQDNKEKKKKKTPQNKIITFNFYRQGTLRELIFYSDNDQAGILKQWMENQKAPFLFVTEVRSSPDATKENDIKVSDVILSVDGVEVDANRVYFQDATPGETRLKLLSPLTGEIKETTFERSSGEFAINMLDLKGSSRTQYKKIGDTIEAGPDRSPYKILSYEKKEAPNARGILSDVSELTIENTSSGEKIVLIYNQELNDPSSVGIFRNELTGAELTLKKDEEFTLPPDEQAKLKVVDISETSAQIQDLKTGVGSKVSKAETEAPATQ